MLFLKEGVHKIIKPIAPLLVTFFKTSTSIPGINQLFVILSNLPKFIPSMHEPSLSSFGALNAELQSVKRVVFISSGI